MPDLYGVFVHGYDYDRPTLVGLAADFSKACELADSVMSIGLAAQGKGLSLLSLLGNRVTEKDMDDGLVVFPWNHVGVAKIPEGELFHMTGVDILYDPQSKLEPTRG